MRKIKLPRKRKKAYKKSKPQNSYIMIKILAEILVEEGRKYGDRFYELEIKKRGDKRFEPYNNGYAATKRW
jgi:hypothetical protein|tara:strand:- start:2312 stop:2524 length:213 start_codon:yes stop_codon:yes gene_type:complete